MDRGHSYSNNKSAKAFGSYAISKDAETEHDLIWNKISKIFPDGTKSRILDAACGNGWLSKRLFEKGYEVSACDISPELLSSFEKNCPKVEARVCDLNVSAPYEKESFDFVVVNMSFHDFSDLDKAISVLSGLLVAGGKMIATVANPYYSHPVGRWKRGLTRRFLGKKPLLRLYPYNFLKKHDRRHVWFGGVPSYFYTMEEYLDAAFRSGLSLESFKEICSDEDSSLFDRKYQLHRFPMILLMVFQKK